MCGRTFQRELSSVARRTIRFSRVPRRTLHARAARVCARRPRHSRRATPSLRTTRWHGIATARLFAAQAPATARTAFGAPIRARSRHRTPWRRPEFRCSACHTRCWNAVPRTSSGRSRPSAWRLDITRRPAPPGLRSRVGADEMRFRKAVLKVANQLSADRRRAGWQHTPFSLDATRMAPSERLRRLRT